MSTITAKLSDEGKPDGSGLSAFIGLRLNAAQAQRVREGAAEAGKSVSDYVRELLLGAEIKPKRRRRRRTVDELAFGQALAALNKIGVNINQIARIANSQKHVTLEEFRALKVATAELQEARTALLSAFGEET